MEESLDILAFAPHPDDAEYGCGGSLILAADQGLRVAVADLSNGETSSRGTPEKREWERKRAASLLGLQSRFSLGLPDTEINCEREHRLPIIELVRQTRPRVVLIPYWSDRHPDHSAASELVRNACFFAGVRKIGKGVPHRPERIYYYSLHSPLPPSFVIDISTIWERKVAAITAYESQFQPGDSGMVTTLSRPDFMRALEARAVWFGAMIGATYGEAFYSPGPVPMQSFPGLNSAPPPPGEMPPYSMY